MIVVQTPKRKSATTRCRVVGPDGATVIPLETVPLSYGHRGAVGGIDGGGWRTEGDPACVPGSVPLWPGGPALPAWVEAEGKGDLVAGVLVHTGGGHHPPTPGQLVTLGDLGWQGAAPATRREAREMIALMLGGYDGGLGW